MSFEILYHPKVENDMTSLDKSIQIQVLKKIKELTTNPEIGKPLGNKAGMDLTGYRKIYVYNKKIRIIYKLNGEKMTIYVIAVGQRNKMSIYKEVEKRINKQ